MVLTSSYFFYGILQLSLTGYIVSTLILTHITIVSVTLYLHRSQAHRAVDFKPIVAHFFRFWIWLTTSQLTNEWVAVHRAHHAKVESKDDPHSPVVYGVFRVLFLGVFLYTSATRNKELVRKYSQGTPDDWVERFIYQRFHYAGLCIMLFLDLLFFGICGFFVWGVQMLWIPFHAAGVINGLGHYLGYRNFECQDMSTNILPWGFWIGGEELHNNHHAFPDSAKFSSKWYEFDLGYLYLKIFSFLGLAVIKRIQPTLDGLKNSKKAIDSVVRWKYLLSNRLRVMDMYVRKVLKPSALLEKKTINFKLKGYSSLSSLTKTMTKSAAVITKEETLRLKNQLVDTHVLQVIYDFYKRLESICSKSRSGQKEMFKSLDKWCKDAAETNIGALKDFALWIENTFLIESQKDMA